MIDGCTPIQTFFKVVLPIMKPTCVTVAILETMWIWNDYLLPYLVLDIKKYKTISIAIQYLKGGYGTIDMGAMMACSGTFHHSDHCLLSVHARNTSLKVWLQELLRADKSVE